MWRFKFHPYRHPFLASAFRLQCGTECMWEFEPMGDGAFSSLRWNWWNSVWYGPPLQFQAFFLRSVGAFNVWYVCFLFIIWIIIPDDMKWLANECKWVETINLLQRLGPVFSWGWCLVFPSHVSKARLHSTAKVWSVTLSYTLRYSGWWCQTCLFSIYIGNVIIPTDELIFFRGVVLPPTSMVQINHH